MQYARGQGWRSRAFKRIAGAKAYEVVKAGRLVMPLRRESYSQNGEDTTLLKLLTGAVGTYLDIGSGNPVHLSNTYGLYRRGWSGVLVDPLWANGVLTRLLRPRDSFIRGLVSSSGGRIPFFELDPSFYSTTDLQVAEGATKSGAVVERETLLTAFRASDLPFRASPDQPSVLSIDVEGHELPVLKSLDWSRQSPQLIVVEMWGRDSRDATNHEVSELLSGRGYSVLAHCGPDNTVFGHADFVNNRGR